MPAFPAHSPAVHGRRSAALGLVVLLVIALGPERAAAGGGLAPPALDAREEAAVRVSNAPAPAAQALPAQAPPAEASPGARAGPRPQADRAPARGLRASDAGRDRPADAPAASSLPGWAEPNAGPAPEPGPSARPPEASAQQGPPPTFPDAQPAPIGGLDVWVFLPAVLYAAYRLLRS
jgi:hypothetical protein